jgi:general L-amino acid transport system substrate-binding protein
MREVRRANFPRPVQSRTVMGSVLGLGALTRALSCVCLLVTLVGAAVAKPVLHDRVARIQARGSLGCGIAAETAGFASPGAQGSYRGFDTDLCRALAAAILKSAAAVRFVPVSRLDEFLARDDVDVTVRRLTWTLQREGRGLLFGPIMFYDGQGFMLPRRSLDAPLAALRWCVSMRGAALATLVRHFKTHDWSLQAVPLNSWSDFAAAQRAGRCDALSADVSELGAVRSALPDAAQFAISDETISKEPLAPVVRQGDDRFFTLLRWTMFALIDAEELGVTSKNVDTLRDSSDERIRRLLGATAGNGRALGLDENWAARVIRQLGNYGEIYARNVGVESAIGLKRGLNRLWTDGGLLYAPPAE